MRDIRLTVVYASIDRQTSIELTLSPLANVAVAIRRSGILEQFSELELEQLTVGIYGRKVALDALLNDQDRIEIYRSLTIDPMTARRRRVGSVN